ncbi:AAA family ATPase [Tuwongella immobilis]|uniref:Rad50/SbcC-type AAA domain-containing protein n=1 Tax=Tuwongella immobilis TaxID=692036 RepID=A0A6C2YJ97_9BACT|nr:SMC family ATPase [Tuwongella immobilis]VIP01628.1 ATPase involved in DNA repair OS=Chthonomonas calidirosea (strain DSM 23976 / ICMP 18418 / T49) GN=CCALI_02828 PE=4 SV=1: SMC_N [Tuwongella immobilis]VTR98972.1 ATPase involved in DNA repair OS=Chthonomonas calidirosea (strain DSM 23976 / ICMP 18418 / T49) GN=CCALI_02828 PE=4 SV=1: SMC_N [Tuwongella immobilis]
MNPIRLTVEGFLSYRDAVTLEFARAPLCLLAGHNGSGKSSLFDAISMALFGIHRGGQRDFARLIHHQADRASIQFEFDFQGNRYRVDRTIQRPRRANQSAATTRGAFRWQETIWKPIDGTEQDAGFNQFWTDLGITDELFGYSVLLRQGQAEALLDAKPSERTTALNRLFGIDRIETYHAYAREQAKRLEAQTHAIGQQIALLNPLNDADYLQLESRVTAAQTAFERADAEEVHWRERARLADRFQNIQRQVAEIDQAEAAATALHQRSPEIVANYQRLQELRSLVPQLNRCQQERHRLETATQTIARLTPELEQLRAGLASLAQRLTALEASKSTTESAREQHQQAGRELPTRLAELKATADRLGLFERHCNTRYKIADRLALDQSQLVTLTAQLPAAESAVAVAIEAREAADSAWHAARDRQTQLQSETDRILKQQKNLRSLSGESTCDRCGQTLTAAHREQELARLESESASATRELVEQRQRTDAAKRAADAAKAAAESAQSQRQQLFNNCEQLRRDIDRSQILLSGVDADLLAGNYRDWPAWLPPLPASWEPATPWEALADWYAQSTQQVMQEQLACQSERQTWDHRDTELRTELGRIEAELRQIRTSETAQQRQLAQAETGLTNAEQIVRDATAALAQLEQALPMDWRGITNIAPLQLEWDRLNTLPLEQEYQSLGQLSIQLERWQQSRLSYQQQLAEIPDDARLSEAETQQGQQVASVARNSARAQLDAEQAELRTAQRNREQAAEHLVQQRELQSQANLWRRWEMLLDRNHYQQHVLQHLQTQIVALANQTLSNLSQGAMSLQLDPNQADQLLALQVVSESSNQPRDVAFLSGSERFRVAISLAIAIGEVTGMQQVGSASLMIDEGFGCLDADNRDLMRDELRNLESRLQQIIVVTHQDDFAESFEHGYRLEKRNGCTQVSGFGLYAQVDAGEMDAERTVAESGGFR